MWWCVASARPLVAHSAGLENHQNTLIYDRASSRSTMLKRAWHCARLTAALKMKRIIGSSSILLIVCGTVRMITDCLVVQTARIMPIAWWPTIFTCWFVSGCQRNLSLLWHLLVVVGTVSRFGNPYRLMEWGNKLRGCNRRGIQWKLNELKKKLDKSSYISWPYMQENPYQSTLDYIESIQNPSGSLFHYGNSYASMHESIEELLKATDAAGHSHNPLYSQFKMPKAGELPLTMKDFPWGTSPKDKKEIGWSITEMISRDDSERLF